MSGVSGRIALVTGAGGDMGRAHALSFAAGGAGVIVNDVDRSALGETAARCRAAGAAVAEVVGDVADIAAFRAGVAAAENAVGPVDILVNNAGVSGRGLAFETIDEAAYDRMFAVHVKGSFFAAQYVASGMKVRRHGRIINISSTFGIAGGQRASHYGGAKGALLAFTKTWARELAPFGITVNAVAPGFILTNMTRGTYTPDRLPERTKGIIVGRAGEPDDVTRTVLWLAADEASFVTAQVISPNGGEYIY
ncbi:MAG: SDR family oxidoreductase [Alphaproteobacteria bacterium]|nr:SDR family oxidoreductase [Alphaproteobacteria bacterium]